METKRQLRNYITYLEKKIEELKSKLTVRDQNGLAKVEECEGSLCAACAFAAWSTYDNTTFPNLIGCAKNIKCKDFKPLVVIEKEGNLARCYLEPRL